MIAPDAAAIREGKAPNCPRARLANEQAERAMTWLKQSVAAGYNPRRRHRQGRASSMAARPRGLQKAARGGDSEGEEVRRTRISSQQRSNSQPGTDTRPHGGSYGKGPEGIGNSRSFPAFARDALYCQWRWLLQASESRFRERSWAIVRRNSSPVRCWSSSTPRIKRRRSRN